MKLASLGVVAVALGIGLDLPGLIGIGIWWVLIGPVMRRHGKDLTERQEASPDKKPPMDGRTFAYGTLLWALLGIPSLVVGIGEIGLAEEPAWKWLPIVVGGLAVGIGGVAGLMMLTGNAMQAVGEKLDPGGAAQTPATLWLRAVRETGTFINERPRMELDLRVEPDAASGLAPYEVTKKATVPFTALYALRPGDGFRGLVVGPEDPTAIQIGWDQPVEGPR